MIEKSFGREIKEMMKTEDPKATLEKMGEAIYFYAQKVNDAFTRIYAEDAPYILAALDTYRNALAEALDPIGERGLEEAVRKLEGRISAQIDAIYTNHPITETAAREMIKAAMEHKGREE